MESPILTSWGQVDLSRCFDSPAILTLCVNPQKKNNNNNKKEKEENKRVCHPRDAAPHSPEDLSANT
jgi:hypothetical protein